MERISSQRLAQVEDGLQTFSTTRFERQDVRKAPLAKLVGELLDWIGGPIDLEALVNVTAVLRGVRDHPTESLDDEAKGYLETRVSDTTLMSSPSLDFYKIAQGLVASGWRVAGRAT